LSAFGKVRRSHLKPEEPFPRRTELYDRTADEITLDEIERIVM